MRVLSYGAGADSFAMLCYAVEWQRRTGQRLLDLVIFADVADPEHQDVGEWPETYAHLRRIAEPLAEAYGIPFKVLGTDESPIRGKRSLFAYFMDSKALPSPDPRRPLCTMAAKIDRLTRYTAERWPAPTQIETWIGFDASEESRIANDPYSKGGGDPRRSKRYPLCDLGLCRCRLVAYVRRLGLPSPPKSACQYCPKSSKGDFGRLLERSPGRFEQVEQFERNAKRTAENDKELRLAGNYKKGDGSDPWLREWASSPYKMAKKACPVCGAPEREPKLVGIGDPLPPGPFVEPPAPVFDLRSLATGVAFRTLGHAWAVGLPPDADPSLSALYLGPAMDELRVQVSYVAKGEGPKRFEALPGTVTAYAGRPMLVAAGTPDAGGRMTLHAAVCEAAR